MTKRDNRIKLTPTTDIERQVFDHLQSNYGSTSGISNTVCLYYLLEWLSFNQDRASDPWIQLQIREAVHCFEARAKLIRETFPDLFPREPVRIPDFSPYQPGSSHPELSHPGSSQPTPTPEPDEPEESPQPVDDDAEDSGPVNFFADLSDIEFGDRQEIDLGDRST